MAIVSAVQLKDWLIFAWLAEWLIYECMIKGRVRGPSPWWNQLDFVVIEEESQNDTTAVNNMKENGLLWQQLAKTDNNWRTMESSDTSKTAKTNNNKISTNLTTKQMKQ